MLLLAYFPVAGGDAGSSGEEGGSFLAAIITRVVTLMSIARIRFCRGIHGARVPFPAFSYVLMYCTRYWIALWEVGAQVRRSCSAWFLLGHPMR